MTPQHQRIIRKAILLRELDVTVRCIEFYVACAILGFIPEHPGLSAQV